MSDAEYDGRPVVYLLHGVDTTLLPDGTPYWYRHVMSVLHPFFRCVPLRYTAYDKGGKRQVATWGGGFAIALGVFASSFVLGWSGMPVIGATAIGTTAVGGMVLSIREWIRRSKTADAIAADCSSVSAKTLVPSHVIAHSFGTYLLKRVLDEVELRLNHVVLVGSALSPWTDWDRLWSLRHALKKPFVCIRNEYSPKDHVAGWAGYAWPLTGCGAAGKYGFSRRGKTVAYHSQPNAYGPCGAVSTACTAGPVVHNVRLEPFTHSSVFLSEDHAKRLWLPVLLDIPPAEYAQFLDDCVWLLAKRDDEALLAGRAEVFAGKAWTFLGTRTAPVTIRDYVYERLPNLGIRNNWKQYLQDVCETTAQFFLAGWQAEGESPARAHLLPAHLVNEAMKRALAQPARS